MFNLYEDSKVKEAWRLFTGKGMLRREVLRQEVALSWARCQMHGVSPVKIKDTPVSPEEYHLARNNAQALVQSAAPYFENFMAVSGYDMLNLALADSRGLILVDWIQKYDCFAYRQGISVMEDRIGTNAAALAVQHKSPYTVTGAEHYIEALQSVQTIGVPVMGQDGSMAALVAAAMPLEADAGEVRERLEHLASLITGTMQIQKSHLAVVQLKDHYAAALDALPEAILCFDRYGQILHGNKIAKSVFAHKILELTSFNIRELMRMDQPIKLESLLNDKCRGKILEGYYDGPEGLVPAVVECVSFNETGAKMGMLKFSGLDRFRTQVNQWAGRKPAYKMQDIVGCSVAILEVRKAIRAAAQSDFPCLITGETGTGKKVFAQVVHQESPISEGPYYYLDCASVPKRELDAELFGRCDSGQEPGRMGILELADGGSVHLDNIGELPLQIQGKLLKYLDTKEFKKVGSDEVRMTRVRIISSSRNDLQLFIQKGLFRQELYNRLICNRLATVPIRYRKEDIGMLVDYLITEIIYPKDPKALVRSSDFYERLSQYNWPGNVRELQRAIQLILYKHNGDDALSAQHVAAIEEEIFTQNKEQEVLNLEILEHEAILKAIEASGDNLSQTAKILGIGRSTLYRKLEKYGIQVTHNEAITVKNNKEEPKMVQLATF